MKPGQPTTHTYDYKHYGTTTLFADLNVLEGKVISRRMQRRRNQKLIASSTRSRLQFRRAKSSTRS